MIQWVDWRWIAGQHVLGPWHRLVETGQHVWLRGPTGSGKTSLLETMVGLRQPSSGQLRLRGVDVTYLAPRHRRIGYVPQDGVLFSKRTVEQNLLFGVATHGIPTQQQQHRLSIITEALELSSCLSRRPSELSGGEKQRVALGRILVMEPDILILDEPTTAQDQIMRDRVNQFLASFARERGVTVLHVSHDEPRDVDLVWTIDEGI
ncbi:MAG: ATP-binding cassette domain-containing protein [Planctomycetota bacterium]